MLSDFLLLESYYGPQHAALFFEDLNQRYDRTDIFRGEHAGDLVKRRVLCGANAGRDLYWLSEQGRKKASA